MSQLPIPTSVRFPPEIKEKLVLEAEARRWSVSVLLNEIVKQWLSAMKRAKKS